MEISIHAPLRERPNPFDCGADFVIDFNPRSLTGATKATDNGAKATKISIHAPLRERRYNDVRGVMCDIISIHAPLRERHKALRASYVQLVFQSTLPYGSDYKNPFDAAFGGISIHAPLRERRMSCWRWCRS